MRYLKNILLAYIGSAWVFTAIETKTLITIISTIVLPILFFTIGKTIDVMLRIYFRNPDNTPKKCRQNHDAEKLVLPCCDRGDRRFFANFIRFHRQSGKSQKQLPPQKSLTFRFTDQTPRGLTKFKQWVVRNKVTRSKSAAGIRVGATRNKKIVISEWRNSLKSNGKNRL